MLYATTYFMSRIITFTKMSAEKAVENLRSPSLQPYIMGPTLASRLLNLQLKKVMHSLQRKYMIDVLAGLENLFAERPRKSSWAEAFSVHLILCMCVEQIQVAVDAVCMAALRRDPACVPHSLEIIRSLDDGVYRKVVEMFHMAYKTAQSSLSWTERPGFNPIRDGLKLDETNGVTPQMIKLVQDVRQIMICYGKDAPSRT
jgi:hypothetical protein